MILDIEIIEKIMKSSKSLQSMWNKIIIILFISSLLTSNKVEKNQKYKNNIYEINKQWDKNKDSTFGNLRVLSCKTDKPLYDLNILYFRYYTKLIDYLDELKIINNLIRIINLQRYQGILFQNNSISDYLKYYQPQAFFLYKNINTNEIHIVYIDSNCNVKDIKIIPQFDFDYLLSVNSYTLFGKVLDHIYDFGEPYDGRGICISVANGKDIFTVETEVFWRYTKGKIDKFYKITGINYTSLELQKLLKQLYEMGIIQDEVFETKCK